MLNPCCFCKSAGSTSLYDSTPEKWFIQCTNGECCLMGPYGRTQEEAGEKWNRLQCKQEVRPGHDFAGMDIVGPGQKPPQRLDDTPTKEQIGSLHRKQEGRPGVLYSSPEAKRNRRDRFILAALTGLCSREQMHHSSDSISKKAIKLADLTIKHSDDTETGDGCF